MSENKKVNLFDLNPLVIEVENVIQKGLNKILENYMDRYTLLENTHKQIMRLPSIRQELNKNPYESDSDLDYDTDDAVAHKNHNRDVNYSVNMLDCRLDKLEKKYDAIIPVLDKILNRVISLDHEVKSLKTIPMNDANLSNITTQKENIKIHFEEPEELAEEKYDDSDVEDNPHLITCSTVASNKEPEKLDEDEELSVGEEIGEHNIEKHPDVLYSILPSEEVINGEEEESEDNAESVVNEDEAETVVEETSGDKSEDNAAAEFEENTESNVEETSEDKDETVVDDESEVEAEEQSEDTGEAEDEAEEDEASIETETNVEEADDEDDAEPVAEKQPKPSETEEDDDEELFEIEIDDKTYCTNDDQNGFIWVLTDEGEQGDKVGYLKDGDAYFYEDEN